MAQVRKKPSKKEEEDKKRFDEIFKYWPAYIAYLKGPQHIYYLANPLHLELVGKRDIIGKTVREALPELKGQGFFELLDKVFKHGKPYVGKEALIRLDRRGNGQLEDSYLNFVYQPVWSPKNKKEVEGILVHAVDVTEQVQARKRVEESEERLKQALEAGEMGTWDYSLATDSAIRSLRYDQIFGYNKKVAHWNASIFWKHVIPEDQEVARKSQEKARKTGKLDMQVRIRRVDGEIRWIDAQGQYIYNAKKKPIRMVGTLVDITGRKEVEEEARKIASIIELSQDAIISNDENGLIVSWNQGAENLYGYKAEEVLGKPVTLLRPSQKENDFPRIKELMKRGKPVKNYETKRRAKDGKIHDVSVSISPLRDRKGELIGAAGIARDISDRKKLEAEALRAQVIIDLSEDAIISQNTEGIITSWNRGAEKLYGYSAKEAIGQPVAILIPPDKKDDFPMIMGKLALGERVEHYETLRKTKDGRILNISVTISPIKDEHGNIIGASKIARDITGRKKAEDSLKQSEERFRTLVQEIEDYAIFRLDPDGKVTSWNEGVEYILGYKEEEFVGKHVSLIFTQEDVQGNAVEQELSVAKKFGRSEDERFHVRKDGTRFQATGAVTSIHDEATGKLVGFSKILRDITERVEAEEAMQHLTLHDPLTDLPNRKALEERLSLALAEAKKENRILALMFLDLDRFKNINDSLGHETGDLVLKEVANRLRESIGPKNTVARLGGDEFIIMLTDIRTTRDAVSVADKLVQIMHPPIKLGVYTLHVSASIGLALYPNDGVDLQSLLKHADIALYRAKENGGNRFQTYNQAMNVQAAERFNLENDLRQSAMHGELKLCYQPIIDLKTNKPIAAEALVRWHHPHWGILYPNEFIPLAEETGIIFRIGKWVIREACRQNKAWQDSGLPPIKIAVNLSAREFSDPALVQNIRTILHDTKLDPKYLDLELTETVAMENIDRTTSKLRELKQMGVSITIDDFGTGYSSLSYLRRFPIHNLKIDRSFVRHCMTNDQDSAIVKTIIAMASTLNLRVIAEGVESEKQLKFLSTLECMAAQGHFLSKPIPAEELGKWLELKGEKERA